MLSILSFIVILNYSTLISSEVHQPFVFGGNNATRGQFKYFGSLRYVLGDVEVHGCGASILNSRWALSAAHCLDFDRSSIDRVDMVTGVVELNDPGMRYNIIEIINHPAYVNLDLSQIGIHWVLNDVGLIKTDRSMIFNDYVQPIAIERNLIRRNSEATFAGFGASEESDLTWQFWTNHMQYVQLRTLSEFECRNRVTLLYLRGQIPILPFVMDNICTEAPQSAGICFGDSGSGLVVNDKLVGVASFILGACPSGFPEFFARVSSFANWIDSHILSSDE